jgi:PAS domain S-box-containing protein
MHETFQQAPKSRNKAKAARSNGRVAPAPHPLAKRLAKSPTSRTENADRYRAIMDAAVDAIVIADHLGEIQAFNHAAENIFGYAADEAIGRNIKFLMPEAEQLRHDDYLDAYRETGVRKIIGAGREVVGLRHDGTTISLDLAVAEWRDAAGQQRFTGIIRDVTERNLQARQLRDASEIAQQARLEAESASRAKTEFLAVMSHEIRTPMTSISGFMDLLAHTDGLNSQQSRYIELVQTANAALLAIVNDILDFSKVEAGRMELERHPFRLAAAIDEAIAIVAPSASMKNLSLRTAIDHNVPEWLMGDDSRLRQILLNLLTNAIKFTEKGAIMIHARSETSADGRERIRFSVTDTGIGIAPDLQHRLFKKFSQADSSMNRQHGGTGLGLAICKQLVELMDGQIGIHSDVDQGSTFWFTASLPAASAPEGASTPEGASAPEAQATGEPLLEAIGARMPTASASEAQATIEKPPQAAGGRKPRILVVDDIETNCEIVEAYLSDNGYEVATVCSAVDAIRILQSERYDVVLMDIQMPGMDGVTATKCIRALPAPIKDIPIIAMTGHVMPQQVQSLLAAGMNDHVAKPIERVKLYSSVRRWINKNEVHEGSAAVN